MNDIEQKIIKHEEQIKTLFENQKRIESVVNKIDNLAIAIEKMAVVQTDLIEEQKDIRDDLKAIKSQPAKDAHELKMTILKCIITAVVSGVLGALIALIVK